MFGVWNIFKLVVWAPNIRMYILALTFRGNSWNHQHIITSLLYSPPKRLWLVKKTAFDHFVVLHLVPRHRLLQAHTSRTKQRLIICVVHNVFAVHCLLQVHNVAPPSLQQAHPTARQHLQPQNSQGLVARPQLYCRQDTRRAPCAPSGWQK